MQDVFLMPIHAAPLGVYNLGETARDLNKDLIRDIEIDLGKDEVTDRTFHNGRQTKLGLDKTYSSFKMLKRIITPVYMSVLSRYGVKDDFIIHGTELKNFWGNVIYQQGGFSEPHIHGNGNTFFTGVYYPNGIEDEKEDLENFNKEDWISYNMSKEERQGCLCLMDASRHHKEAVSPEFDKVYKPDVFATRTWVKPRQSLLLIFPVWMQHMVYPVMDNLPRYSISFSINRKK